MVLPNVRLWVCGRIDMNIDKLNLLVSVALLLWSPSATLSSSPSSPWPFIPSSSSKSGLDCICLHTATICILQAADWVCKSKSHDPIFNYFRTILYWDCQYITYNTLWNLIVVGEIKIRFTYWYWPIIWFLQRYAAHYPLPTILFLVPAGCFAAHLWINYQAAYLRAYSQVKLEVSCLFRLNLEA